MGATAGNAQHRDVEAERAEAKLRARLGGLCADWFPALDAAAADRIVAAALVETRGEGDEPRATRAAAALRRHGLRALRGDRLSFGPEIEAELARLHVPPPPADRPEGFEGGREAPRSRSSLLARRRVSEPRAPDPEPAPRPEPVAETSPPSPRRRRAAAAPAAPVAAPARSWRSGGPARHAGLTAAPGAAGAGSDRHSERRGLAIAALACALVVGGIAAVGSMGKSGGAPDAPAPEQTLVAEAGTSGFASVVATKAGRLAEAQRREAAAADERRAAAAKRRAAIARRRADRRAAARKRRASAAKRRRAAAARRRPAPARSVPAPAPTAVPKASVPAPAYRAPAPRPAAPSSGGGSWGGEFGP